MIRLLLAPVALLAGAFLIVVGVLVCAAVVGAPIGLALIGAGVHIFWL